MPRLSKTQTTTCKGQQGGQNVKTVAILGCAWVWYFCPWLLSSSNRPASLHQALRLPRNLHVKVHQVLRLPRNLHFEVHQALCLQRNLHFEVHKVLYLSRNLFTLIRYKVLFTLVTLLTPFTLFTPFTRVAEDPRMRLPKGT